MKSRKSRWIRIKKGNFRGAINPELRLALTAGFLEDLDRQMAVCGGSVVKDSRVRWAATVPVEGGRTLFVKQFRMVRRWQRFRYLIRPSRAMKECLISRFLSQKGIPTPKALGILEKRKHGVLKECFFVDEANHITVVPRWETFEREKAVARGREIMKRVQAMTEEKE
ncbi:MAG: hypothetical protein ACE5NJ_08280 [Thermodesulfobacteriota bacterium]